MNIEEIRFTFNSKEAFKKLQTVQNIIVSKKEMVQSFLKLKRG